MSDFTQDRHRTDYMVVSNYSLFINNNNYVNRAAQDQLSAVCECDKGWNGTNCEILLKSTSFWNNWGPWGSCKPECGNLRHRKRQRSCGITTCVGDPEELMDCDPHVCETVGKTEGSTSRKILFVVSYFMKCRNHNM